MRSDPALLQARLYFRRGGQSPEPIVAGDLVDEERILELGTPSAIMDDHRSARGRKLIRHDRDVGCRTAVLRREMGANTARQVVPGEVPRRRGLSVPGEKFARPPPPPVIDVAIAAAAARLLDHALQVDPERSIGAHDHIRADPE